jgi:hypothetical protein
VRLLFRHGVGRTGPTSDHVVQFPRNPSGGFCPAGVLGERYSLISDTVLRQRSASDARACTGGRRLGGFRRSATSAVRAFFDQVAGKPIHQYLGRTLVPRRFGL